jgi:hypothetical protein
MQQHLIFSKLFDKAFLDHGGEQQTPSSSRAPTSQEGGGGEEAEEEEVEGRTEEGGRASIEALARKVQEANRREATENSVSPDSFTTDKPDDNINNLPRLLRPH